MIFKVSVTIGAGLYALRRSYCGVATTAEVACRQALRAARKEDPRKATVTAVEFVDHRAF